MICKKRKWMHFRKNRLVTIFFLFYGVKEINRHLFKAVILNGWVIWTVSVKFQLLNTCLCFCFSCNCICTFFFFKWHWSKHEIPLYVLRAQNLESELTSRGWPTTCIAGSLDQKDRITAMAKLKSYKCRVLISTDLVSINNRRWGGRGWGRGGGVGKEDGCVCVCVCVW